MTTMILENLIPFHLLKAAQDFEKIIDDLKDAGKATTVETATDVMSKLEPAKLDEMLQFMRQYAHKMVIEPIITLEDDGNPDHLPVTEFSGDELMAIVYARGPRRKEEPVADQEQAKQFSVQRGESSTDAPPLPVREEFRPETKLLDFPDREAITA